MTERDRSLARMAQHLRNAGKWLAVAAGEIAAARDADPEGEKYAGYYRDVLSSLGETSDGVRDMAVAMAEQVARAGVEGIA